MLHALRLLEEQCRNTFCKSALEGLIKILRLVNAVSRARFRKAREGGSRDAFLPDMIKRLIQSAFIAPSLS